MPIRKHAENLGIAVRKAGADRKSSPKTAADGADLKQELGALKLRLLEEKVDAVETGSSACVLFEQGLSTVDVRKLADKRGHRRSYLQQVFNGSDTDGYQYVICAVRPGCFGVWQGVQQALCGRGGGKNPMIQGQVKAEQKAIWNI